ncbi:phosphatase PAP2 family protein [Amnibacterium sp. CER49]|uniref:phosphatase PAP2 family protein n=1 Tax=Amnibacterium sp. CER49 TaxID=3039161 RepID=UPI00244864CC|nr:phosphatase PAP2 family protein [Amnibacterium sp. CER49]MDH2442400.1 phosphatase PAP2 family protein [Amnibacterium sp. CER49]
MVTMPWSESGAGADLAEQAARALRSPWTRVLVGLAALFAVLLVGLLVHLPQLGRRDLHVDVALSHWRSPIGTALALGFTAAAKEVVGLAALAVGLVILLIRRRLRSAAQLLVTAGTAWGTVYLIKAAVDRARPPASLELAAPDGSASFPSGHTATAAIIVLIVWFALVGTGRFRVVAALVALAYAAAVAVSRVYLADHFPTDVLASLGVVLGVALLVSAAFDSARGRRIQARLEATWARRRGRSALPHA